MIEQHELYPKGSQDYSNIIYDGLWFGPLRTYLEGFGRISQGCKWGSSYSHFCRKSLITGRRSRSLYDECPYILMAILLTEMSLV